MDSWRKHRVHAAVVYARMKSQEDNFCHGSLYFRPTSVCEGEGVWQLAKVGNSCMAVPSSWDTANTNKRTSEPSLLLSPNRLLFTRSLYFYFFTNASLITTRRLYHIRSCDCCLNLMLRFRLPDIALVSSLRWCKSGAHHCSRCYLRTCLAFMPDASR